MQTVQLKCLKFNDNYIFSTGNGFTGTRPYSVDNGGMFGVPARGDNDAMRHYAYHQFVRHGKLGIGNHRVILSYCVWQIRQTFPSENGQYTGFKVHRLG